MTPRVTLIGIDGLGPYITKKHLPNLLENSLVARLRSTIPPITAPAWVSMATGLNPGKTGVIDFLNTIDNKRRKIKPVSSSVYRGLAIWDYASLAGYRVCIIDYPMLYPPYPINGVLIPGFLSPNWSSYPESLSYQLQSKLGPHWDHVYFAIDKKYDDVLVFLEDVLKNFEKKIRWSLYILCEEDWELFIDIVSHSDWLFHRCWHILDPNHTVALNEPELREEAMCTEAKSLIEYFFEILVRYISEVEARRQNIIMVSDHGFGPLTYTVNSAKLLKTFNLTRFTLLNPFTRLQGLVNRARWFLMPQAFKKTPFELNIDPYDVIDYDNSILYTLPNDELLMTLYVNSKYCKKRDEVLKYVEKRIRALSIKLGVSMHLIDLHKFYTGCKTALLPDALVIVDDWATFFEFKPYSNYLIKRTCNRRYTGTHRAEGVFIAKGTNFRKSIKPAYFDLKVSLLDVAPTLLHLLGIPVPRYIDGIPRTEIIRNSPRTCKLDAIALVKLRSHYAKMSVRICSSLKTACSNAHATK